VSSLLGGSKPGKSGKSDTVSRAKTIQGVLFFAEAAVRPRQTATRLSVRFQEVDHPIYTDSDIFI
jgi:hypothetical protein